MNKKNTIEKILKNAIKMSDEDFSLLNILENYPQYNKELNEIFEIDAILKEEKKIIETSSLHLTKILESLSAENNENNSLANFWSNFYASIYQLSITWKTLASTAFMIVILVGVITIKNHNLNIKNDISLNNDLQKINEQMEGLNSDISNIDQSFDENLINKIEISQSSVTSS